MSKESMQASTCPRCGRRMYYAEQHLLVCDSPLPQPGQVKRPRKKKEATGVS